MNIVTGRTARSTVTIVTRAVLSAEDAKRRTRVVREVRRDKVCGQA